MVREGKYKGSGAFKSVSKIDYMKRKPERDDGHWEGKYWCDCRLRNKRKWLGLKKYGPEERDV